VRELVVRIIETMMMVPLHGAIESRGPELLERRMKALFGNRPAEMEIRVAKWFREARGAHVFFNDNPDTHRTADLTVDGHLVDVKLVESAEEIIRERVEDGLLQVAPSGSNGIVVLVCGEHALEDVSVYHHVAADFNAKPGSPTILVLEEYELPPLFEIPRPPRPRGDEN
jgi:broad specificity phosphatase PhoE